MLKFYNQSEPQGNIIFRSIYSFWAIITERYHQLTGQSHASSNPYENTTDVHQQRRYVKQIYIAIICIVIVFILFMVIFIVSFLLSDGFFRYGLHINYKSRSGGSDEGFGRHIYIDIGCFNGETVDYFLQFTPDSSMYEIYTFEPDPDNYRLCKKRLSQKKYSHLNINILQKVVWIRDETVYFRSERGRQSRISLNFTENDGDSIELDAIDFSAWLARLVKPNQAKIHIKMSTPGAEVPVLEKMIRDDTLGLASRYEVEWADRENPRIRAVRIYIQLMFDTYGFDCVYYTRLQDARRVFQMNGSFDNVIKYFDWRQISESDALAHYIERVDMPALRDIRDK